MNCQVNVTTRHHLDPEFRVISVSEGTAEGLDSPATARAAAAQVPLPAPGFVREEFFVEETMPGRVQFTLMDREVR